MEWIAHLVGNDPLVYAVASLSLSLLLVAGLFASWFLLFAVFNLGDGDSEKVPWRSLWLLFALTGPLSWMILDVGLSVAAPPVFNQPNVERAQAVDRELALLRDQASRLRRLLDDAGELTLAEAEATVSSTLVLSESLSDRVMEQQSAIAQLRVEVASERAKAAESTRLAQQVQGLAREQLDTVKLLITEDAQRVSERSFLLGIAASLPLGISASLIASRLTRSRMARLMADAVRASSKLERH